MSFPFTKTKLYGYIPEYYGTDPVMAAILSSLGGELDLVYDTYSHIIDQYFVRRASWSLDTWELEYGLPNGSASLTTDQRRDRLIARITGTGTATSYVVSQVAAAYQNGAVHVIEDFPNWSINIVFSDVNGIPANLSDVQAGMRALVPAHLTINYQFRFFVWDSLDARDWTWDELDAMNLTWDQFEILT